MTWGSLKAITDEAKEIARQNADRELLDCPICGNPLTTSDRDVRNCDVGHFTTDRKTQG